MFTNLLNVLFGKPGINQAAKSRSDQHLPLESASREATAANLSNISDTKSAPRRKSLKQVRASWTHGRYEATTRTNVQQQLNMMYAPPVHSLVETEASVADVISPAPAQYSGALDFSPTADIKLKIEQIKASRRSKHVSEILAEISLHPNEEVRFFIASNAKTPEVGLRALANDPSERVRVALINNPSCPQDLAKKLICDRSSAVSFNAVMRIRQSWVDKRTA